LTHTSLQHCSNGPHAGLQLTPPELLLDPLPLLLEPEPEPDPEPLELPVLPEPLLLPVLPLPLLLPPLPLLVLPLPLLVLPLPLLVLPLPLLPEPDPVELLAPLLDEPPLPLLPPPSTEASPVSGSCSVAPPQRAKTTTTDRRPAAPSK
jgi:hypothetical protein